MKTSKFQEQNRLRKRNGNELTRLSQRKRCGNTNLRSGDFFFFCGGEKNTPYFFPAAKKKRGKKSPDRRLRKHETMPPFSSYTFPVETVVRKRNGMLNHQVSATFPSCGNTLFHPVKFI